MSDSLGTNSDSEPPSAMRAANVGAAGSGSVDESPVAMSAPDQRALDVLELAVEAGRSVAVSAAT